MILCGNQEQLGKPYSILLCPNHSERPPLSPKKENQDSLSNHPRPNLQLIFLHKDFRKKGRLCSSSFCAKEHSPSFYPVSSGGDFCPCLRVEGFRKQTSLHIMNIARNLSKTFYLLQDGKEVSRRTIICLSWERPGPGGRD